MPSTGWLRPRITSTSPASRRAFIAQAAAPTPGRMTFSAERMTSASFVSTDSTPSRCRAYWTEPRLAPPELITAMVIFGLP